MSGFAVTGIDATAAAVPGDAGGHSPAAAQAAVAAAKQALATDQFNVQTDQRNHSPSCEAYDQKQAETAAQQLAQAEAQAQAAGVLNITV